MRVARDDFIQYVYKLLEAMRNNQINGEFIKRVNFLETNFTIYNNLLKERIELKVQRIQASENLSKTEDVLIEKMRSTNLFIQSLISTKDGKYREFVQTGKINSLLVSSMGVLIEGAKYFLEGLKKNKDLGVSDKVIQDLESAITDFDNAIQNSQLIKQKETNAILKLKENEDDFRSIFKKTIAFVKSQIDSSEYHNYFD